MSKATSDFKIYLNSILNKIDDEIHEELWTCLTHVITEQIREREAYHQSELKEITDEEIEMEARYQCPVKNGMEGTYEEGKYVGFDMGAEWLLTKLKQ